MPNKSVYCFSFNSTSEVLIKFHFGDLRYSLLYQFNKLSVITFVLQKEIHELITSFLIDIPFKNMFQTEYIHKYNLIPIMNC